MIWMIVFLIVGFVLLIKGADLFVDGACALSEKMKIPAYLIGLTVVALGTSLPEAAVSITASISGSNEIAIGNVIGSNIFNTLVVLGASALFAPVAVKKNLIRRDFPFCILITVLMLALMLTMGGGEIGISRVGGIILLAAFVLFMTYSIISGKKEAAAEQTPTQKDEKEISLVKCLVYIIIGVAGVIAGGQLTVKGATMMAQAFGMSETVIGLTVVAIGTSLPELVTSVVASRKKKNDIAVGNVIGSNVFNILFILGMSAAISPIKTAFTSVIDACVLIAVCVVTYIIGATMKKINRPAGVLMILLYAAYTAYLLIR